MCSIIRNSTHLGHATKKLDVEDAAAERLPVDWGQGAAVVDAEAPACGRTGEVPAALEPGANKKKVDQEENDASISSQMAVTIRRPWPKRSVSASPLYY
jgi:hypothetical protein